jgi:hypothetical protein
MRTSTRLRTTVLVSAGVCASLMLLGHARDRPNLNRSAKLGELAPPTMLWAWEEPEDLRGIDPRQVGVAFLAERVFLGARARVNPRRQNLLVPSNVYAIAVARMEADPAFEDSETLRKEASDAVLRAADLPNVRGLQVDFDATASQHEFYADVLRQVRSRLPPRMGLTVTALVSWCSSSQGWLRELPVDAAVPMYFRLGKHAGGWEIREPLCTSSVGVSIDEPGLATNSLRDGTRAYVFAPHPWTGEQLAVLNREGFPSKFRSVR